MGIKTKIEWAHSTASPWYGCRKVSPGCANCYIESVIRKMRKPDGTIGFTHGNERVKSKSFERDCRKWQRDAAAAGHSCTPHNPRIFPSLCDWLDPEVPAEWLADALRVMHECGNLNFLLLTKRPENFNRRMSDAERLLGRDTGLEAAVRQWIYDGQPPANVWLGTSCEAQKQADLRIPFLQQIPAAKRFLSLEPLLGPVDLAYSCFNGADSLGTIPGIDWVIVGGESGPNARPCNIEWIRDIVRQCKAAGVPCFVKQLGSNTVGTREPERPERGLARLVLKHPKGGDPAEWPEDLRVREIP